MQTKQETQELRQKAVLLYQEVANFAFSRTKDREAASDIAQDVMETAMRKLDTLRNPDSLKQWIMKLTINQINAYFRQMKYEQERQIPRQEDHSMDDLRKVEEDILDHIVDVESRKYVMEALLGLEEKYQTVIRYHLVYEWPLIAIAEKLSLNYNTVKTRYSRGIKYLRAAFFEIEEGHGKHAKKHP